jgi:phospholipase/carboxylesterase
MNMELQTGNALAYRASASPPAPRRLLILSHGVGGNEMNLAPLAARAPVDTVVILVRAPLTLAPGQFAWFPVSFGPQGPRPDLAAAEDSRQRLALFVAEMQAAYGVAPNGTVVAGFSQGGIISASVALTQPKIVAGFGVLAGRILPEIEPRLANRQMLARIQGFIGHGRDDTKLPVDWAHRADAWLTDLGVPHETHLYPGDHGIPQPMQVDFFDWFQRVTE